MVQVHSSRFVIPALLAVALHLPSSVQAGCSRPILVPAAPAGQTITMRNGEMVGVIPDMFKVIGAKAGCTFKWSVVPRVRLEAMFEGGRADLLVAATQLERRDRTGVFVPVFETRPTLISVASDRARVSSYAELLERRELRVALVRGYDYGDGYRELSSALAAQGRLYLEPDSVSVARLLHGGMADVTIMPASAFIGALKDDPRVEGLIPRLRTEVLDDLPWIRIGIYLSRKSLKPADLQLLETALVASVKTGAWWTVLQRYYPPSVLAQHARPYDGGKSAPTAP